MATRKDLIISKTKQAQLKHKFTDIETIFFRWYDFNEHKEIFEYRNEYSNNYKLAHMYNFQNIETWLKETQPHNKPNNDPMHKFDQTQNRKPLGRQLVNVGFDNTEVNYTSYSNEEFLPPSIIPDDRHIAIQEDPFAQSDDSSV
ncbi:unnamed protein product [Parnassius apollo]|uniref:(apollo) hypothetical protein n=1 Tax=Parnassius apollo TaxID=110799 RepID=A0A8S3W7S1_PARAO|nr:unnamed protein product [Parnassius apollo]